MEIQDQQLIVLSNDGQFLTTRKKDHVHYRLGEEIIIDSVQMKTKAKTFIFSPPSKVWISAAAAMVLLLASFLFNIGLSEQKVYAYVTVDINPSFELSLDDELKIIEIVPLNKDAKNVLAELTDWKDQPFYTVTALLVETSKEEGYLSSEQTVILSTVLVNENEEEELEEEMEHIQSEIKKEDVEVKWFEGTEEDRKEAKTAGISTGKLIETRNENKTIETNKNKEKTPKDVDKSKNQDRSEDVKRGNSSKVEKGSKPNKSNDQTGPSNSQKNEKEKGQDNKNSNNDTDVNEEEDLEKEKSDAANQKKKENIGNNENGNNGQDENGGSNEESGSNGKNENGESNGKSGSNSQNENGGNTGENGNNKENNGN